MSHAPESVRYERKFIPRGIPPEELSLLIQRHPAGFREIYPPRHVNSVYLDTPALGDFHDHVAGLPNRSKIRIRWYGPLEGPVPTPHLERKQKRGHLSWKESHPLPPLTVNGTGWGRAIRDYLEHTNLPEVLHPGLHLRQPVLLTRYLRRYFLSSDGRFRLTLDTELTLNVALRARGSALEHPLPAPLPTILELKFPPSAAPDASRVTQALPFRITRCSKYILGLKLLLFETD